MTSEQLKSDSNYKILGLVGEGDYGTILKIRIKEDDKEYALKQIDFKKITDDELKESARIKAEQEFKLLQKGIPNVLKSFGSYYDCEKEVFMFTTELMTTDLETFIVEKKRPLTMEEFIPIFKDIIQGKSHILK